MFLVAPSEPPEIKVLGTSSSVPEMLGVDILWKGRVGLCGVQRKTVSDLIASVRDDRLGKEFQQMQRLAFRGLVVEGTPQWTRDGEFLDGHQSWSLKQHRGVFISAQIHNIVVLTSRNHLETLDVIHQLEQRTLKDDMVSSLLLRGNDKGNDWGRLTGRSFGIHFMSAIPGIGIELAGRIFDHFGKVPLRWSVPEVGFLEIKGIGKLKLEQLKQFLPMDKDVPH